MTFQLENLDPEEVQTRVNETVTNDRVVLFVKDGHLMSQCGHSAKAVDFISQYVDEFKTVDVLPAFPHYREMLREKSDWETIPQTFVGGEFVGSSNILEELDERSDPEAMSAGVD